MKLTKTICSALTALLLTTACSDKEPYRAGFAQLSAKYGYFYANTTADSLFVSSYGPWQITALSGTEWCQLDLMSGKGYANYAIGVKATQNTTGYSRTAQFKIVDTDRPSEAYSEWIFLQTAVRGDGSMGNAPAVDSIVGTDGSRITMTYDPLYRPLSLRMEKNGSLLRQLTIDYNDASNTMTVKGGNQDLTATYDNGYQGTVLKGQSESVGFYEQQYYNLTGGRSYAFNIEERHADGSYTVYAHLVGRMNAHPDSLHNADSLRYGRLTATNQKTLLRMKLSYSNQDNRRQTVDANQLLLGVEECNPFMLLSMFRYARNSNIISRATCDNSADNIDVSAELNTDKSVKKLTVKQHGEERTYTFYYGS